MYFVLTASKDTYITDKIINNSFSASDANVGQAATLDLFRLYDESSLSGMISTNELSRALIKFDFGRIQKLMSSELDLNHGSFNCSLELFDIMGGQVTPSDFTLICFPLSQSFDEGLGRDTVSFSDLDASNFYTASYVNGTSVGWFASGANEQGKITHPGTYPENIDVIVSGNLNDGGGMAGLGATQYFKNGTENLKLDVTTIVSATIASILPDHGFRLSFTGSQEEDNQTRFVKRFASRHVRNRSLQPRLVVSYDNTILDHHQNFYFDLSGSIFLNNFHRGQAANLLSGSTTLTQLTGSDCLSLTLRTGSFKETYVVSQHQAGTKQLPNNTNEAAYSYVTGVYSATFAIPFANTTVVDFNTTLMQMAARTGSLTFDEYWHTKDRTVTFYTGSLTIKRNQRTSFNDAGRNLDLIVTNARPSYDKTERVRFRIFVKEFGVQDKALRVPYQVKSLVLEEAYYRVIEIDTGAVIIPFKKNNNGTRMSTDSEGMFFDVYMDSIPPGRNYTFEFDVLDRGTSFIHEAKNVRFRVEA